jgi:predicted phosphodiesterase
MALIAVFADVHNKTQALERALAALARRGVTAYWQLGDLGAEALALLEGLPVQHVFGNWEVSSLPHLPADLRDRVAAWPAHLTGPFWVASHATPVYPPGCTTTASTWLYMHEHHPRWLQVFPSLLHDERAIWAALAEMEARDLWVAFHGHTHVQAVQQLGPDGRLQRLAGPVIALRPDTRTLVGVGSIGVPRDGPRPRCVLFDPDARQIELMTL